MPVHPHLCGEDAAELWGSKINPGSPPRVWGRLFPALRGMALKRFTPTCVGKTAAACAAAALTAVHPHLCGEDTWATSTNAGVVGSPPPVWGRRLQERGDIGRSRFTPTCVGKTLRNSGAPKSIPVHPHLCGEDIYYSWTDWAGTGSPPPVWGRRQSGQAL